MNIAPQPRVYPAVYSGVGVYECMIRGIAVMRRRADSYVNATQILKVAGIDKGRRTKILEKEILPGKHEIVQGGYGKYQGTWIPLERGRDIAAQYGVAPLLAPLFEYVPNNTMMGSITPQMNHPMRGPGPIPPMHFANMRHPYINMIHYVPPNMLQGRPPMFPPGAPIYPYQMPAGPPGSQPRPPHLYAPHPLPPGAQPMAPFPVTGAHPPAPNAESPGPSSASVTPSTGPSPEQANSHKRTREDEDPLLSQDTDTTMVNGVEEDIFAPHVPEGPPPSKKPRIDEGPPDGIPMDMDLVVVPRQGSPVAAIDPNELYTAFPSADIVPIATLIPPVDDMAPRESTQPPVDQVAARDAIRKTPRRRELYHAIMQDMSVSVLRELLDKSSGVPLAEMGLDKIIDDKGHTALHVAAAFGKLQVLESLVSGGADVHRGNFRGETALMQAVRVSEQGQLEVFDEILRLLRPSLRTIDFNKRTVLHHIAYTATMDHAAEAMHYMVKIVQWVTQYQEAGLVMLLNMQDDNGDTALNIVARLGNELIAAFLIKQGANPAIANKFGVKPTDYGIVDEEDETFIKLEETDSIFPSSQNEDPAIKRSEDILDNMASLIKSLAQDVVRDKAAREEEYVELKMRIRDTSRKLAEKRKELGQLKPQSEVSELDDLRIRNLKALRTSDTIEWTGRSAAKDAPTAFKKRTVPPIQPSQLDALAGHTSSVLDPKSSTSDTIETLILLRRMKLWHERIAVVLKQQHATIKESIETEFKIRAMISQVVPDLKDGEEDIAHLAQLFESIHTDRAAEDARIGAYLHKAQQKKRPAALEPVAV